MQIALNTPVRVALFPDTYFETNGVATLSRHFVRYAKDRNIPLLVVRGGQETCLSRDGSVDVLQLKRGAVSFPLDKGLYCDPLLTRHKQLVLQQLSAFKPDLVHITGPGDLGFLGLWVAHILRVPLVASWHTNLHEYLSRRLDKALHLLPRNFRSKATVTLEQQSLRGLLRFYRTARFVLAPNQTLVQLLQTRTGNPAFLMAHGVDLKAYQPGAPARSNEDPFCIGYVGRLTTEKNVRSLVDVERELIAAGERNFKFLIVGEGGQQTWLQKHLRHAEIPGVLRGEQLAAAYGRMHAFVFPSATDTFGLVILEAMASGVPVVLAPQTGQRVGVEDGVSGLLSENLTAGLLRLMREEDTRQSMSLAARNFAKLHSWDQVFEQLYRTYADGLHLDAARRAQKEALAAHKTNA